MTDNEEAVNEDAADDDQSERDGPVATVLGATFGPLGAAFGSVVDENRIAVKFAFGSGVDVDEGSFDRGTSIEIEETESSAEEVDETAEEESRSGIEAADEFDTDSPGTEDAD